MSNGFKTTTTSPSRTILPFLCVRRKLWLRTLLVFGACALVVYAFLDQKLWISTGLNGSGGDGGESAARAILSKIMEGTCQIPRLNPFDDTIKQYINPEPMIDCTAGGHPLIFGTDLKSNLLILDDPAVYGYQDCCYTPFYGQGDQYETYSSDCFTIPTVGTKSTRIPTQYENIAIYCKQPKSGWTLLDWFNRLFGRKSLVDMLNFAHPNSPKNFKSCVLPSSSSTHRHRQPNIVVLGLDSVSHMNFLRSMPLSVNYLKHNLSALEMKGYGLFAENTFANMVPFLMGKMVDEISQEKIGCWPSKSSYFDDCDFIWKSFAKKGYVTSYAEDDTHIGIFLYEKYGFRETPTDYYLVPFTSALRHKVDHRGNGSQPLKVCYGPRLGFHVLLENIKKMATTLRDGPYFQFTWATSLFHEDGNYAGAGDKLLLELLHWMKDDYNSKENTVFILMSDHGARFGPVRQTEQGRLEARMPFLYLIFPDWFKRKYRRAIANVMSNMDKLITPLDMHFTVKDLLDLDSNIQDTRLAARQRQLDHHVTTKSDLPRGISLFLSLPDRSHRKCKEAGIEFHNCFCSVPAKVPTNNPKVLLAAQSAVHVINDKLKPYSQCAQLTLDKVQSAKSVYGSVENTPRTSSSTHTSSFVDSSSSTTATSNLAAAAGAPAPSSSDSNSSLVILVTFRTLPNEAIFEATLAEDKGEWILSGVISRINKYGDQARCVTDFTVKSYCYCS